MQRGNLYTRSVGDPVDLGRGEALQPVGGWFSDFFGWAVSVVQEIIPVNLVQSQPGRIVTPGANQSQASYTYADPQIPVVEQHVSQRWYDVHGTAATAADLAPVYDQLNAYYVSSGATTWGDPRIDIYVDQTLIPYVQSYLGHPDPARVSHPNLPAALPSYSDPGIPKVEEYIRERFQAQKGHWPTDLETAPLFEKANAWHDALKVTSWDSQPIYDYIDGVLLPAYVPDLVHLPKLPDAGATAAPAPAFPTGWILGGVAGVAAIAFLTHHPKRV